MNQYNILRNRLSQINENNFEDIALEVFKFQVQYNSIYSRFLTLSGINPSEIKSVNDIPFLPIRFFKSHEVKTGNWVAEKIFRSSGTTATGHSMHHIREVQFYLKHAAGCFEYEYGELNGSHFFAILPSYTERDDASLAAMAGYFIDRSRSQFSGFFLGDSWRLRVAMDKALDSGRPVILMGVTFALLDLVQSGFNFSGVRLIETGGMKGRGKEMVREELHQILQTADPLEIGSEYGMTELLSQAYARGGSEFKCSAWMKILTRELNDHRVNTPPGATGVIHVVDLANLDTCSFIETQDLGRLTTNGFEVLGRMDHSDLRGCSLMTG